MWSGDTWAVVCGCKQKSTTSTTNIHNRPCSSCFLFLLFPSTLHSATLSTWTYNSMGQSFNVELPVSVPAGLPQSNTIKSILHILQVLCTFITVCVIASVISTEMKFYVCRSQRICFVSSWSNVFLCNRDPVNQDPTGHFLSRYQVSLSLLVWWYSPGSMINKANSVVLASFVSNQEPTSSLQASTQSFGRQLVLPWACIQVIPITVLCLVICVKRMVMNIQMLGQHRYSKVFFKVEW